MPKKKLNVMFFEREMRTNLRPLSSTSSQLQLLSLSGFGYIIVTLKMAFAQVVETSVNNNSPSQDSNHPDDLFQSRYVTPGFKPFSENRERKKFAESCSFDFREFVV